MIRKRVVVSGRVQGVFFRDSCRSEAIVQGVAGWVRNLPDGSVEAVFEGEPEAVARMVEWAHRGSPSAVVEAVRETEEEPEGLTAFDVR
ncbi:acylphosphatase [Streptomyces sp. YIM 98790]|uniref:acylphosphatase n=1 Tax=Streptomyces sp. YIM 98790 TaxID=2689077 RepID=UPI001A9D9A86|nr:acylphosphatase [Streptomyces sp. YIM 98790]